MKDIKKLIKKTKIKGREIEPLVYLMEKTIKGLFRSKITGNISTLKECFDINYDEKEKSLKCDFELNNGAKGLFLYDYEKKSFVLIVNDRHSYVPNQFWLFKKLKKWGYVKF